METQSSANESRRGPATRQPLARKVLFAMTIRLMLVTIALTGFGYVHVMRAVTDQSMDGFERYAKAKGDRESELFRLAEDNHAIMRKAFVDALHDYGDRDPVEEFERRYEEGADGSTFSRQATYDGTRHAGFNSDAGMAAKLDADTRRRILSASAMLESFGRAYQTRFLNTWFTGYDGIALMFWPERPNYSMEQDIAIEMGDTDYITPATPEKNPERKSIWTKSYIDPTTKLAMVSLSTPVYDKDRYLGVVAHDILLKELVERTMSDRLEGTYNVLLRDDGFLIAHPQKTQDLASGGFDVMKSADTELQAIYRQASSAAPGTTVVESEDGRNYLGIARIAGPNWFLVAMYPKAIVEKTAFSTARFILLGGLVSLAIELVLFYALLKGRVTAPLAQLRDAIRKVTAGERTIELDSSRDDELGELAESFQTMALSVKDREEAQKQAEESITILNLELASNLEREKERNEQLLALQREVDDLSTPVLEVWRHVLALPIIGVLDEARGQKIMERLLDAVVSRQSQFVILDITGTHAIDAAAAERLMRVVSAVELLGARCVLTGVRPAVARAIVEIGADFGSLKTLRTLRQGLELCVQGTRKGARA